MLDYINLLNIKKTYALAIKERIQQGTLVKADNQGKRTL